MGASSDGKVFNSSQCQLIVNVAVLEIPPADAEIVALVLDDTFPVLTTKLAEVLPARIVTLD